jgi:serine protease Do
MKNICKRLSLSLAAILLAAAILTALIKPAAAESGFTGMQIQGMSQQTASALGLKSTDGVLVRDVALGGPADKAGIKRGDLILNYGSQRIDSFKKMMAVAGITKPGQEVKVSILREGKPVTLTMKLGKWTAPWRMTNTTVASLPQAGLTLATLTRKLRKGLGLRWSSLSVVVTLIDPDKSDIGLRRGDVITQVNQEEIWKPDQLIAKY